MVGIPFPSSIVVLAHLLPDCHFPIKSSSYWNCFSCDPRPFSPTHRSLIIIIVIIAINFSYLQFSVAFDSIKKSKCRINHYIESFGVFLLLKVAKKYQLQVFLWIVVSHILRIASVPPLNVLGIHPQWLSHRQEE